MGVHRFRSLLPGQGLHPHHLLARGLVLLALFAATGTVFAGVGDARAIDCFTLSYQFVPAEGGASTASLPTRNCGSDYLAGTVVTTQVNPANGWRLVAFSGGPVFLGNNTLQVTMDQDRSITLFMARELASGVPSPGTTVAQGEWRYFVIDVPPGATDLQVQMAGTNDADLYTRHGAIPLEGSPGPATNDCRPFLGGSAESCSHPDPADGTWYIGVRGDSALPADVTVTATMAPCYPVTIDSNPPGFTPNVSPSPNCPGGFIGGTEITVTPVTSEASPFTHWLGSLNGNVSQPLVVNVNGSGIITAAHAMEVSEGNPLLDQFVAGGSHRFFYVKPVVDKPSLKLYTISLAPGGLVSVNGYPIEGPPGDLCLGGTVAGPCVISQVPGGDVWFRVAAEADSTLEVSADHCVAFYVPGYPALSGEVTVDPAPECETRYQFPGYYNVQGVAATAVPGPGYVFAGWNPGGIRSNPYNFPLMGEDFFGKGHFAAPVSSGVPQVVPDTISFPHYYYIDVPQHTATLEFQWAGSLDAVIVFDDPFGQGCYPVPQTPCVVQFPTAGRWWVLADRGPGPDASFTVTLTPGAICHPLVVSPVPGNGGTVSFTPPSDPACPEGSYTEGSSVTVHATANGGWAFASGLNGGIVQDAVVTMNEPKQLKANFGRDLQGGTGSALFTGVFPGEYRYAYVDVPAGTAFLDPAIQPVNHGYDARLYPPGSISDCYFNEERDPFECAVSYPAPGRWWLSSTPFLTSPSPASDAFTMSITLSDVPHCWSVTANSFPAEGAAGPPVIVTPPNCEGGKYVHGTSVTIIAAAPEPDYASFLVGVPGLFQHSGYSTFSVLSDTNVTFYYAQRLLPGPNTLTFPAPQANSYFVDVPPGGSSLAFTATGLPGLSVGISGPGACALPDDSGPRTCTVTNPEPGRWLVLIYGVPASAAGMEITLSPAMAAVISHVSPAFALIGGTDPVEISVHGFGFDPGEVALLNGVPLPTVFQSSVLLTATIPVELLGTSPQSLNLVVAPAEVGPLRSPLLTSNIFPFLVTRPSSDVDCNGSTTAADALVLMQALAGFESAHCYEDVNQDYQVSLADILRIRLQVAGLVSPLPMPLLN